MSRFDIPTLVQTAVADLVPSGNGGWRFPLEPGAREWAAVRLAPNWAIFECSLPQAMDETPSPLAALLRHSQWPGNVKIAGDRARPLVRAEVPLMIETAAGHDWVTRQIGAVVRGLRMAAALPDTAADADDTDAEMLAERCRAAGWHATAKADGEVHIEIAARSVQRVVSIARQQCGLRARVTLGNGELAQGGEESIGAAAHFLLRASCSLRFVRAWATAAPCDVGFECAIPAGAADAPLMAAIDALATACDLFGCEAEALIEGAAVARRYLQMAQGARRSPAHAVLQLHGFAPARIFPRAATAAASA